MELSTIIFAFLGGLLPALLWLWFWLREDKEQPEPTNLLILTFIAGMFAVPISIVIQGFINGLFNVKSATEAGAFVLFLWASAEELIKYTLAYFVALRQKYNDEAIDPLIYMITIALGFAALENTLYLIDPISKGKFLESLVTGNYRFIGSTLLHTLSSATIGIALALSFKKDKKTKRKYAFFGIVGAILTHFLFNFSLLQDNLSIYHIFPFLWIVLVGLLVFFEYIKKQK